MGCSACRSCVRAYSNLHGVQGTLRTLHFRLAWARGIARVHKEILMTLARELSFKTIQTIQQALPDLVEQKGPGGGAARPIAAAGNPEAGALRIWEGSTARMVYIGLNAELPMRDGSGRSMVLDSHMIFAFSGKHSPVPHFTLDAISAGPVLAFHLDLIPRVDLGARLEYMNAVYGGALTEARSETLKHPGFSEAPLSPRQLALMSPWMLAKRATPEAFKTLPVDAYLDRWFSLLTRGVPEEALVGLTAADFAERDRLNREALFNKDVDPVWHQIEAMIGADVGEELRTVLKVQRPA
jgi:hypothetical protein